MKVPSAPAPKVPTESSSAPTPADLLMAAATMHSAGRLFEKPPEPQPADKK